MDLDLNAEDYTKKQKQIITESKSTALSIEKNWRIIGSQSDAMYEAMRQRINNAYEAIKNKATSTSAEIARADRAAKAQLQKIDEQQFGRQTTLIEKLKNNWIAYTAIITATFYAVKKGIDIIDDAIKRADNIAKTADVIGVTTDALQEYRYAADLSGVSTEYIDKGLQKFTRALGEAKNETGPLTTFLQKYDQELLNNLKHTTSATDGLNIMFRALSDTNDISERNALSAAAFGRSGQQMIVMIKNGNDALEKMRKEARDLGMVIDEQLLRNAETANDRFTTLSYILKARMTSAILELAPQIQSLTENIIKATTATFGAIEGFDMFFGISKKGALYKELNKLNDELNRMEENKGVASWLENNVFHVNREMVMARLKSEINRVNSEIQKLTPQISTPKGITDTGQISNQDILDDLLKQQQDYEYKIRQLSRNTLEQKRQDVYRWIDEKKASLEKEGELTAEIQRQLEMTGNAQLNLIREEYLKDFNDKFKESAMDQFEIEREGLRRQVEIWEQAGADKIKIADYTQKELSKISKRENEFRLGFYEETAGGIADTFQQIAQAGGKYSKEAFEIYKAAAIAEATISAALAISKALGAYPPPYSFIAAAVAGAAAGVQIATIARAEPPSYDSGGISDAKGIYQTGDIMEAHVPIPSGKIPVQLNGNQGSKIEIHNHIEGNTFYDAEKQRQVFTQIAEITAARIAPAAVVRNFNDGGMVYHTLGRGR